MKQPKAFITGIAGFAGSWLAEELLAAGYAVSGSVYNHEPLDNIAAIAPRLELMPLDILDPDQCQKVLSAVQPDMVFHLAAQASVGNSFTGVRQTLTVNLDGSLNVFEAAGAVKRLKALVFVSSADVYGVFSPRTKTLTERQPLNPISPYGIAKAAAERAAAYFHRVHGLPVIIARSFNHTGPRQTEDFVVAAFARQVALIETAQQPPTVQTGDLSAKRDFSDVRDIVRGYRLAAEKGTPGEAYQFCSGRAVTIQTVLDTLVKMSTQRIRHQLDRARLRRADIPVLRGNHEKAAVQLGFTVRYKLKDTLADTLVYWRHRVSASKHTSS